MIVLACASVCVCVWWKADVLFYAWVFGSIIIKKTFKRQRKTEKNKS